VRSRPSWDCPRNVAASDVAARSACVGESPASTSSDSSRHRLKPGGTAPHGTSLPASSGTPLSTSSPTNLCAAWSARRHCAQANGSSGRAACDSTINGGIWWSSSEPRRPVARIRHWESQYTSVGVAVIPRSRIESATSRCRSHVLDNSGIPQTLSQPSGCAGQMSLLEEVEASG